jgi:LCP family protein required for cell wall assembly
MLLPLLNRPLSVSQPTKPAGQPTANFEYIVITNTPDPSAPSPDIQPSPNSAEASPNLPTPAQSPTPYPLLSNGQGEVIPITWGDYPGPASWPSFEIPAPIGIIPAPQSQVNILILGNDYKKKQGSRTDMVMLLTLNPEEGTAAVTSFPRDLYVYAPGWTMMKINTIQPRGGYDLLKLTFEYNFGVRPDYYVNISVDSFADLVNTLGGIDVNVTRGLTDPTYVNGKFSVGTGMHHFDGATAKWYVRSRNTSGDIYRNERQQAVLEALFKKLMSRDAINHAPELYNLYARYVFTDLSLNAILPLSSLASQLYDDPSRVQRYALDLEQAVQTRTPIDGAYILLPDSTKVLELMVKVLEP